MFPANNVEVKLERIDLRATDATTQLASVAGADIPLVYSSYSGAGAVTVVKSFKNLGLQQPLVVSYANISGAFADLVKDVKPPRLLGTAAASIARTRSHDGSGWLADVPVPRVDKKALVFAMRDARKLVRALAKRSEDAGQTRHPVGAGGDL